jgi:hypothetical protein
VDAFWHPTFSMTFRQLYEGLVRSNLASYLLVLEGGLPLASSSNPNIQIRFVGRGGTQSVRRRIIIIISKLFILFEEAK